MSREPEIVVIPLGVWCCYSTSQFISFGNNKVVTNLVDRLSLALDDWRESYTLPGSKEEAEEYGSQQGDEEGVCPAFHEGWHNRPAFWQILQQ
jgi:hypothetical protein